MSFVIPVDAYGERTSSLQALITQAEGISLFSKNVDLDEPKISQHVAEHLATMSRGQGIPSSMWKVEIVRGAVSLLADCWIGQSEEWRGVVGEAIGDMHRQYSKSPHADRLRLPIWPIVGVINVFSPTFVANEATYRRCQTVSKNPREAEVCWKVACFVEKLIDAALVAELFCAQNNPFTPLLSLCTANLIPIGVATGRFCVYVFDEETGA